MILRLKQTSWMLPSLPAIALVCIAAGCTKPPQLMPTPNLYAHTNTNPYADVPPALQNSHVDVLYLTDRQPEEDSTPGHRNYDAKRSRSIAYGLSRVQFGKELTWDQVVAASRTQTREVDMTVSIANTVEMGRFPPTPEMLVDLPSPASTSPAASPTTGATTLRAEVISTEHHAQELLSKQLALSPVKDVYVFIHGYANTFDDSVRTIAQVWHFLGRRGVPVAYSWPAGYGGLRGYTYDRESSEFTVYHLKQMLRRIAENPDVHKVHIISHSRGTDVALSALRELHLEFTGGGESTRDMLKLGTLVIAAPDLDLEVVIQRMVTARLGRIPEHMALYVCSKDNALGVANWLFGGATRLGKVSSDVFSADELETLRRSKTVEILDARVSRPGDFGHNYFYANPAVSSDLILLMRYQLRPGAENGRPLHVHDKGFWEIYDNYPQPAGIPTEPSSALQQTAPPAPMPTTQPAVAEGSK